MAAIVDTLRALLCNDNALRHAAEQQYESLKKDQPGALVAAFLQVLAEPRVELPVREQAAVLLRQCLSRLRAEGSVWSRLAFDPSQHEVCARLLQLFQEEQVDRVRRKVADCIQSVGNQLIDLETDSRPLNAHHWPELLPALMRIITTSAPALRADALWTVKELTDSVWQVLVASAQQTAEVLGQCLSGLAEPVRANAACVLCELLGCIPTHEERKPLLNLLPLLLTAVEQLAASEDSQHLKIVLQELGTLRGGASEFCREAVGVRFLSVIGTLAQSHGDDEAKRLALEVLCSLMETKPKAMLRVPSSLALMLDLCVRFLMELDDDVDAWVAGVDDESEQQQFGAEVMDRICKATQRVDCFAQTLATLHPVGAKLLSQGEWKAVVAGLVLLRQVVEYIEDEVTLAQMLREVKAKLEDSHPRVRCAAWGCVQQFAQDHADLATADAWTQVLLPKVLSGLEDECPRVVLACMEAFHHYGENVEPADLQPVVEQLMDALGRRLGTTSAVQREAITCIAVIAGQLHEGFARYYGPLMPVLKQVIAKVMHSAEERSLLGKAFECISLLANAVGKEVFMKDAESVLGAMAIAAEAPGLASDDPVHEYVMAAAERVCSTLREAFLPFLPRLLPTVLAKLTLAPKEVDEGHSALEDDEDVELALVQGANGEAKIMVMQTAELEDVKNAIECVRTFVEKLGRGYAPFVPATAQALLPTFEFSVSEEVRDLAFETWGQLCHCTREGGDVRLVSELVLEFMKRTLPKLEAVGCDEVDTLKTRVDGVSACLREAGPGVLSNEQVRHICQVSVRLVEDHLPRCSRARAMGSATSEENSDSEDDSEEAEQEAEQELCQSACNCITAVMMQHPGAFLAEGLPLCLPILQRLVQPGSAVGARRLGLYMASSLCQHLGEQTVPQWPGFMPQVLQDIASEHTELRSPACYATSFAGRQPVFAAYALDTAERLAHVVAEARAGGRSKSARTAQMAADNALSALLEILLHHEATLGAVRVQLWGAWVGGLPCQEDEAEGVRNHGALLQFLQQRKPEVVGEVAAPRLLAILVEVYQTRMVDDVTSWGIGQLLAAASKAQLEQYTASFTEKQRKKLVRIVRDGQTRSVSDAEYARG